MNRRYFILLLGLMPLTAQAGFSDWWKKQVEKVKGSDKLDPETAARGIKEALKQGAEQAIKRLGKKNGFALDARVKIPVPENLLQIERGMRKIGAGKYADQFILSINRAAEHAVPQTKEILISVIRQITVKDAIKIIRGADDAATQFFRDKAGFTIKAKIFPIVARATDKVGVTSKYKSFVKHSGWLRKLIDPNKIDLDQYVTDKTVDGLFFMIAEEEKRIRKDPVARTSEILKKVFRKKK